MAIRYSGDAEIRLRWDPRTKVYRGTVRDPYRRWRGEVKIWTIEPQGPAAYDRAAKKMIVLAMREKGHFEVETSFGGPVVRRVFQAPCPARMVR